MGINMGLPIKTTEDDVFKIIGYLKNKPTGSTIKEASSVLGSSILDSRKISAYVKWGLISKENDKIKLLEFGKILARSKDDERYLLFQDILRNINPYHSVIEYIYHQKLDEVTNIDIASFWHDHCTSEIGSENETSIKQMAVCFFHLCHVGGIGDFRMGRKKQPTRLVLDKNSLEGYISGTATTPSFSIETESVDEEDENHFNEEITDNDGLPQSPPPAEARIFISHSKNVEILDQIKTMLDLAGLQYEIVVEEETTAIPVPEKVFKAMRKCNAAIICVTADEQEIIDDQRINQNVLIEIGAAFVLYNRKVILVWDKRLSIPSNLQGLYRCEFSGEELSWKEGMKLMKTLGQFK